MFVGFLLQVEAFVHDAGDNDGDVRAGDERGGNRKTVDMRTQMRSRNKAHNSTVSKIIYELCENKYNSDEFRVTLGYKFELSIK